MLSGIDYFKMTFQEIGLALELIIGHNMTINEVSEGLDTTQKELSEILESVMVFRNVNDRKNNKEVVLESGISAQQMINGNIIKISDNI